MAPTILFVDDDRRLAEAVKRVLRREPYEILIAGSAVEALAVLEAIQVDVLVTDQQMPMMNGTELLSIVKTKFPLMKRIMLSGKATVDTTVRAINEGEVFRFLTKPYNEIELAIAIRQALETAQTKDPSTLLDSFRQRAREMLALESLEPGLTKVNRDLTGAVVLDDE